MVNTTSSSLNTERGFFSEGNVIFISAFFAVLCTISQICVFCKMLRCCETEENIAQEDEETLAFVNNRVSFYHNQLRHDDMIMTPSDDVIINTAFFQNE